VDRQYYQSYTSKVDSLSATLEASASAFEQIDTTKISGMWKQVQFNLDTIVVLDPELVDGTINDYGRITKSCKTILHEYPLVHKELQYSRKQLATLHHDIEHRHLESSEVSTYFKQESEAIDAVKRRMDILADMAETQFEKYSRLNPQVFVIIDSLSKVN
jgi:hypothetical protein